MIKLLCKLAAILLIIPLAACSAFSSAPATAHIHIRGPGSQVKEFVFSIEAPGEKELDLHLSDRHLIEFDLQWLWYEKDDFLLVDTDDPNRFIAPLTPWLIFKYRF
ncbi:MAG: hypothetical protein C4519_20550 [Desulfobacteraceae bacterium]|nr:MAG: hypothetical protein C4519_20550 [Desulfobacteraceae bacterium]